MQRLRACIDVDMSIGLEALQVLPAGSAQLRADVCSFGSMLCFTTAFRRVALFNCLLMLHPCVLHYVLPSRSVVVVMVGG